MSQREKEIALKLKLNDKGAFKEIYSNFYKPVFYFVSRYIPEYDTARDIVQDVFTELWIKRSLIDPSIGYKSIVLTIARNKCLNYLRKRKNLWKYIKISQKHNNVQLSIISLQDETMDMLLNEEFQYRLKQAVDSIPEKHKQVFIMSRKMHLTNSQIAEKLSISEKTVEYRMSCALKILRETFRDVIK